MTEPPDDEPLYRAVLPEGAHPELVEEELDLFQRIVDRLGGDGVLEGSTPEEVQALFGKAAREDEELATMAKRLDELLHTHKGSVIRKIAEHEEREGNWS